MLSSQKQKLSTRTAGVDVFQGSCGNASFAYTLTRTVYPEIARGLELAFCILVECHNNNAQV